MTKKLGTCAECQDTGKYIITKEGYSQTTVSMTEREAKVLEKFIEWACLDDNYFIDSVDDYEAETWGE